ncbi:hypothetical protein Tco_0929975 [Tanacetum coccineum]
MGDENPIHTLGDYSKPSHEGYRNTIELLVGNNVCEIDRAGGGKLRNKNTDESWEIIENLALYDHEGWDETNDFVIPVKAISAPHGTLKTPDRRLLANRSSENQAKACMESLSCSTRSKYEQVRSSPCKICIGPHDT